MVKKLLLFILSLFLVTSMGYSYGGGGAGTFVFDVKEDKVNDMEVKLLSFKLDDITKIYTDCNASKIHAIKRERLNTKDYVCDELLQDFSVEVNSFDEYMDLYISKDILYYRLRSDTTGKMVLKAFNHTFYMKSEVVYNITKWSNPKVNVTINETPKVIRENVTMIYLVTDNDSIIINDTNINSSIIINDTNINSSKVIEEDEGLFSWISWIWNWW